jgi:sulfite exporter TauE/SafE
MSTLGYLAIAGASLVGSAHCAAMCGGFVAAYAGNSGGSAPERALSHAAYNGGRLVTYAALGAVAGALGAALDLAGRAAGVAQIAAVATGIVLLVTGAAGFAPRPRLVKLRSRAPNRSGGLLSRVLLRARGQRAPIRALLLGLFTTLLPCGWLYAFVAYSAAAGGAGAGALSMAAFWLGSLPVMLGVGVSLQSLSARLLQRLPRFRSALLLLAGVLTLVFRFQGPALASPGETQRTPAATGSALPAATDCPYHRAPPHPKDAS